MRRKHNPWVSLAALLLLAVIIVFVVTGCSPATATASEPDERFNIESERFKTELVENNLSQSIWLITDNETGSEYLFFDSTYAGGLVRLDPAEVPEALEPEIEKATQAAPEAAETAEEEPKVISLGEFKITAYCSCAKCCGKWAAGRPVDVNGKEIVYTASGAVAKQGRTIAVDPEVIPYGTMVFFNGQAYRAEDTGGAIDGNHIDLYFDNHQDARDWGVQYHEVSIERGDA